MQTQAQEKGGSSGLGGPDCVHGCWLFVSPHFPKGGSTMEPRQEEKKDKQPRSEGKEEKPRRFRIIKLEERIAPNNGDGRSRDFCTGLKKCC
jgi:hypothetical protein